MYKKILVSVDASECSAQALKQAIGLAKAFGSHVRLIHQIEEAHLQYSHERSGGPSATVEAVRERGRNLLSDALAVATAAGVDADTVLATDHAQLGKTIATEAKHWGAQLVVVGTSGRRGIERFLVGSGAEQIIRETAAPVLVVKMPVL
ncbi:universal stress protein [soil metagenome]